MTGERADMCEVCGRTVLTYIKRLGNDCGRWDLRFSDQGKRWGYKWFCNKCWELVIEK